LSDRNIATARAPHSTLGAALDRISYWMRRALGAEARLTLLRADRRLMADELEFTRSERDEARSQLEQMRAELEAVRATFGVVTVGGGR
jgi:hypothetical protein